MKQKNEMIAGATLKNLMHRSSAIAFPLTPALSLAERGRRADVFSFSNTRLFNPAVIFSLRQTAILPLHRGEGKERSQVLCRVIGLVGLLFYFSLCVVGCVPVFPNQRTIPPDAANCRKVMASAKIGQTTWQELCQQLGSSKVGDYQDSTQTPKLHAMYCRWEVQFSYATGMGGPWRENGRYWATKPGEHLLMIEFDEADRLKRFEFQTASNWEECEKVFSKWVQQSKHESK
jgi:hypothetical protein